MTSVDAVRRFNRFYTRRIGVLKEGLLDSPFSLTEARVIYELAQRDEATATALGQELGLDGGYLSRILRGFQKKRLIRKRPSEADGRQSLLSLTAQGRAAFARLNEASAREVETELLSLTEAQRNALTGAMGVIERLLGGAAAIAPPWLLRTHQSGDIGWVVREHGLLYSREYGWDDTFEALVAEIAAKFLRNFNPQRERCWIAERDGENVGSVFLVQDSEHTDIAKLRLLLVKQEMRGLGIGRRMVQECTRFARRCGYRKITLWTNDILHAARRLYVEEGYRLVQEERHHSFGVDLTGQTWELIL
jgi:DNA-binding MarR family transcriptional regulator/N-acetylglutamate synthase-like GNAT family acetyltransferase